jgi:hypothetical protein
MSEISSAAITATGKMAMNFPITPLTNISGENAIMDVVTAATTGSPTSIVPFTAACNGPSPRFRWT